MPVFETDQLLAAITNLSDQAATGTGIEIADVELRGAGKARLLRVYIDKPSGVTHGDCQLISERLGALLDEQDLMPPDSYTLEVSSPGVERALKRARDFERVVGQTIKVSLRDPVDGLKHLEGKLVSVENGAIQVQLDSGQILQVDLAQIQKANLKFQW
jgi:ribosome maturation factor RimP